ncbi:hypothetical protein F5883DRAFT_680607 [Diaporthe sp. PMI_573]|nr:hypothetical protein F5883DRAFT_680607 [Diaporthaceae sp. PMI_573]
MASNNGQEDSQIDPNVSESHSLGDMDRLDPPPPPNHTSNTPEQDALNNERHKAWNERNMVYLTSFDSRGLHHLPLLSRLWGCDYNWYTARITSEVAEVTSWAGRRLSPEEMSIFTSHAARGVVAASYERPIAIGTTTFALWRGWSSYRMPFYQPRFTTFMHPQAAARPFLSSLFWHSARLGVYGLLGFTAHKLLGRRYRDYMRESFFFDAINFDPGLEEVVNDIDDNLDRLDRERDWWQDRTE